MSTATQNGATMTSNLKSGGLSPDFIDKLLTGGKTPKGTYAAKIVEFDKSDEAGIEPAEVWPKLFGGKAPATLYQSFQSAVKKHNLEDMILVINRNDHVFLIHKERYQLVLDAAEAEAEENENDDNE